ncbi:Dabb family protein [Microbacterium sp. NPDC056234]|uniref:Dabb family protein n=1 Tax=Microbacterium sp. NPDC056234 TaxID=3345757 RepID=UPI0035D8E2CA
MSRIQHTVTFRLNHPSGSAAETTFLGDARATLTAIPGVEDFRVHAQVSPKSDLAFQFSMFFADESAYAAYDQHPTHVAFVAERWVPEVAAFQEFDYVVV